MSKADTDRNLLFGILALQMDFITREQLITAIHAWTTDKSKAVGEILLDQGAFDQADHSILAAMVARHIAKHDGEPAHSLATLRSENDLREIVDAVTDEDVQASLDFLGGGGAPPSSHSFAETTIAFSDHVRSADAARFLVLRPHAKGGLGQVFVARDQELGREVALKEIRADKANDSQLRARFVLEAEINGNLEHPGIVPVYSLGARGDGRPYYAMRFIQGDSLKMAVDRFHKSTRNGDRAKRVLGLHQLLRRFVDVCDAIAYAHSRGVLHRDLKPANIMLGNYGETLIIDWGLAKVTGRRDVHDGDDPLAETLVPPSGGSSNPTLPGSAMGTPQFMSPEQAEGRLDLHGPATDVYGLGATLYAILTGKPPIISASLDETLARVRSGEIVPPRHVRSDVARPLEAVCLKAMSLRREDRYASPREMADDVERWLADEPVSVYAEPLIVRIGRWVRRRKSLVAVSAAILASAIVALAVDYIRVGRERARAEENFALARDAVNKFLTEAAAGRLAAMPQAEDFRLQVAKDAREFNERFLFQRPSDPIVLRDAARVYREVANIQRTLGLVTDADYSYAKALSLLERLKTQSPDDDSIRVDLALTLADSGETLVMAGNPADAEKIAVRALAVADQVLARSSEDPDAKLARAVSLLKISTPQILTERYDDAARSSSQAVPLFHERVTERRNGPSCKLLLVLALNNWGKAQRLSGRTSDAAKRFRNSIQISDDFIVEMTKHATVGVTPSEAFILNAKAARACARIEWGLTLATDRENRARAENLLNEGVDELSRLADDFPRVVEYRGTLAEALLERAALRSGNGIPAEAQEDCNSARKILDGLVAAFPKNARFQGLLGDTLSRLARFANDGGDRAAARVLYEAALPKLESASSANSRSTRYRDLVSQCRAGVESTAKTTPK
jgi:eukaryotic-like serine/threonine-protein kinase